MRRRRFVALAAIAPLVARAAQAQHESDVVPGYTLEFPRDHGSHDGYRIEWWYVTGQVDAEDETLGFQVTFFRARRDTTMQGRFAPRQILFAHTALADPHERALLHAEAASRAGFADAYARSDDCAVRIGAWTIARDAASGTYRVAISGPQAHPFTFDLALAPTQPILLQGERGYSRKGPSPTQASYYYSQPQLAVTGSVTRAGARRTVHGRAWLDHEWSQSYLDPRAAGWDWIGVNLDDGGAVMAFRTRARDDPARTLWTGATWRDAQGRSRTYDGDDVAFAPLRLFTSPRTNARYPVANAIRVGDTAFDVEPLFDDQELDSRAATGFVYWEGAVRAMRAGQPFGRGYLELTGYAEPLRLER